MTRRRAANGQRVEPADIYSWTWECDHAHDTTNGEVKWWDRELTQDEAYAALDEHNATNHPHLTEEARRR